MLRWLLRLLAGPWGRHPSREQLERFLLDGLSPRETALVMRHLVQGCERCRAVTGSYWPFGSDPEERPPAAEGRFEYEAAMSRAFSAARRARADLASGEGQAARLELLLRASHEEAAADPGRAVTSAEAAVEVAEGLGEEHPVPVAEDLRARAWGALAEARRLAADLDGAEEALRRALEHLGRGTGCRLAKAQVLEIASALREVQGRSCEAARLSRRAARLYRREGLAVTRQSPATISANPAPSTQPNLSPSTTAASTTATNGCNVP
ncbi:MAG TPA: hypothetical protein VG477_08565 [Thermoanaerobaculia bacterium]|nr:hypothetical protein [Thermoanaerobaculia bacterium]